MENTVMVYLLWLLVLVILLYYLFNYKYDYWEKRNVPYLKPLPLFGNFKDFIFMKANIGQILQDLYMRGKGPILGVFFMDEPILILRDPDVIRSVLVKDFNHFNDRIIVSDDTADPVGSHILFSSKNPQWKLLRYKTSPIFSTGKLKLMASLIKDVSEDMLKFLQASGDKEVDTREMAGKYATDAITSCAFGIKANSFEDPKAEFRNAAKRIFNCGDTVRGISMASYFFMPKLVKWFKLKFVDSQSAEFLKRIFQETIKDRHDNNFTRGDLIDILINLQKEKSDSIDEVAIFAQAMQFFMAGIEAATTAVSFTLYELALNPHIQDKLRDEIKSKVTNSELNMYDCTKNLKYLEMAILETLRKYPPMPFFDRLCVKEYIIPGTTVAIEKGLKVMIPMLGLNYDPQHFPNPTLYDPERFSEQTEDSRHPFVFMPFGDGPRNCIGARLGMLITKIALTDIILRFSVHVSSNTPREVFYHPLGLTSLPINKIYLKFKRI
ncbi:cytochrome p450 [Rhyzopertha dominica]|nr:cytochrome p450 [Rhyzopertha dominica]